MTSKVDLLLTKATTYEKLSLYGDRKAYLTALAQANLPDMQTLVTAVDNARMYAVRSVNTFWRQDPSGFPTDARTAYQALAYPQTDLKTARGEQLTSAMDQLVAALSAMYRALTAGGEKNSAFAQKTVFPALENLQKQVERFKSAVASVPPPQEEEEGTGKLQMPEQEIVGQKPARGYDPAAISQLQTYLNNMLKGRRAPIAVDGKLGNETMGALRDWAKVMGLSTQDISSLINTALKSA